MNHHNAVSTLVIIISLMAYFQNDLHAQKNRKSKYNAIYVSTGLNYFPFSSPYHFSNQTDAFLSKDLDLTFETPNSGTFTIDDGEAVLFAREHTSRFPTQLWSLGVGLQIVQPNSLFHEFSLTKVTSNKSDALIQIEIIDTLGAVRNTSFSGQVDKNTAVAFRYEIGKYFGHEKTSVKFGLSLAIEPSIYTYKKTPYSIRDFSLKARILNLHVSAIPMLRFALSDKVILECKVVPNWLVAYHTKVAEEFPTIPDAQLQGSRIYNPIEIDLSFGLAIKYLVQVPKKRRRR